MILPPNPIEYERELMAKLLDPALADNPLAWVRTAFRWGDPETFLARYKEPRAWQCEELERLGDWVKRQLEASVRGIPPRMYRRAFCSGHGTGKGALWAMVKHWFKSTRLGSSVIDAANTEDQLRTRTWAECELWYEAAVNKHWFDFRPEALISTPAPWFREEVKAAGKPLAKYFDRGQLYKPAKPDSFAGIHNPMGVMVGLDEASGIPEFVSKTCQGFFTDDTLWKIWFQFSQGRHLEGAFYELFQEDSKWETRHLNALEVEGTDKEFLTEIVEKQGRDSYDARVLVFGLFPNQTVDQFIPNDLVDGAMKREWTPEHKRAASYEPLVMACDPAGGGPDTAVIGFRRGFDMRSIPFRVFHGFDPAQFEDKVIEAYREEQPDVIVIDCAGLGLGVLAHVKLRLKKRVEVVGVNGGEVAESKAWKDRRTELYARVREWLDTGFLPKDRDIKRDLTAPKVERLAGGKVKLQSKRELRKLGLPSPDKGDVVALSMAPNIVKFRAPRGDGDDRPKRAKNTDYDAINGVPDRRRAA